MPYKDPEKRRAWNKKYMKVVRARPAYRRKERARNKRNMRAYRGRLKAVVEEFKKQGCLLCSETDPCCLSAHHRDPKKKDFTIHAAWTHGYAIPKVVAELEKCVCLCENCHRKVHAGHLTLPGRVELVTPAVPHTA